MTRRQAIRLSRPALIGLIALAFVVLVSVGTYLGLQRVRGGGYKMGVRFPTAAGVGPGSQVFFNGVNIGTVDKVKILPDTTVDFIVHVFRATDIPKRATFVVQTAFAGSPTVQIAAPPGPVPPEQVWPKRLLPPDQQPVGSPPVSLEEMMAQGQSLGNRANRVLRLAKPYGPRLLNRVQSARSNGFATTQELRSAFPAIMAGLRSAIVTAKANAASAQAILRRRDRTKFATIAASLQNSARDMNRTSAALASLKRQPDVSGNMRFASAQLRETTANLSGLSSDMELLTKNPQTNAQLRDAGRRLREAIARLKSLL